MLSEPVLHSCWFPHSWVIYLKVMFTAFFFFKFTLWQFIGLMEMSKWTPLPGTTKLNGPQRRLHGCVSPTMSHFGSQSESQARRDFYWCSFLVFYSSDFIFALEFLATCPFLHLHHWLHTTRPASTTSLVYTNLDYRNPILQCLTKGSVSG